jgi:hypothetical protein
LVGHDLLVGKYISTILFHGTIDDVTIESDGMSASVVLTANGYLAQASQDEFLRAYCDKDITKWVVPSELPAGSFRPDLFTSAGFGRGLYLHSNSGQSASANDYTYLEYSFFEEEVAERIRAELNINLGRGVIFDAEVSSVSGADVVYTGDSGEGFLESGMVLYNIDKDQNAEIQSVNTTTNTITVTSSSDVASWAATDEISVAGPQFWASIDSIAGAVITYTNDVGEGNLFANQILQNMTQKQTAEISSFDAGADTITVTDSDHIDGWIDGDLIAMCTSLFYATIDSISNDGDGTGTIDYSGAIGERVVGGVTGYVLYNEDLDEYATVDAWNTGADQVGVATYADISTTPWDAGDVIRIYTPLRASIWDELGSLIWPTSDWRQGAVKQDKASIDLTTTGSPVGLRIVFQQYLAGEADESSFCTLRDVRVYSDEETTMTAMFVAEQVLAKMSGTGHGWDSVPELRDSYNDPGVTLEPMVFENMTPKDVMTWACAFGDSSGNRVTWGLELNERKRMYINSWGDIDDATTELILRVAQGSRISITRSLGDTVQNVRAAYSDNTGDVELTAWSFDSDAYTGLGDYYRRRTVQVDNVDNDTDAGALISQLLSETKYPQESVDFTAQQGGVLRVTGVDMPVEEVQAAGQLVIAELADDTSFGRDDGRNFIAVFQLAGVEVDYDSRTATLMPAMPKQGFAQMIARLETGMK